MSTGMHYRNLSIAGCSKNKKKHRITKVEKKTRTLNQRTRAGEVPFRGFRGRVH